MPKPAASKLLRPKVPSVPGASRRQQYSASTKRALVDVAEELFTENGYAGTSLDAIVAGARVTKGALYHHFSGKQALFEAVFERVEADATKRVTKALKGHRDPWEKALAGLRCFLEVVKQPTYRRVVVQDGPAVLGYERFREQEERSTFSTVLDIVRSALSAGAWDLDEEMVETFSRIFFGAMSSAGEHVASSDDPAAAAVRVETAIGLILAGLRALVESGGGNPTAEDGEAGAELPDGVLDDAIDDDPDLDPDAGEDAADEDGEDGEDPRA
ncbi:TetR/AcrR family transcriptional regulator [Nocardioides perillae]|uniref:AcrR family transcriptional regulator n=1 Tax=Nocardioides perillae TaxID=1119534 RepID=A0A7Y9RYT7_9ACTN|nr:TetR/AcrR family transcriptional regulator [Nocardioides perillae]NYG56619.1 AcrR family transcriptional regulator [Nocardioides perillae]